MAMPAVDALPIVYGLCDEWMARRQMLAALGVEDPDLLETALSGAGGRREQLARFMAAAGGD